MIRVERTAMRCSGSVKRSDPPRPAVTTSENVARLRPTLIPPWAVSCRKITLTPETPFDDPDDAGGVPTMMTVGALELELELELDVPAAAPELAEPPAGTTASVVAPA